MTDPYRSVTYEMRYARSWRAAVVALDMACAADLVSVDEVAAYLSVLNGWTGVPRARRAVGFADENSWSPQEVTTRLVWEVDCGFPRPLCNVPLFDLSGNHLLTPDLLDPVAGVIGEYDGIAHLETGRRRTDRDRHELAADYGLELFTVMAGDLGTLTAEQRMRAARARARFESADRRRWTIDPPSWWVPTVTVAQRRALSEQQRERLLRRRAG